MKKVDVLEALKGLNEATIKELKKLKTAFKAWETLNKPMLDKWARENNEGLKAFAIAVTKGEAGRAEALALNTGDDTTTQIGFAMGLATGPLFWTWLETALASGKLQKWVVAIVKAIIGVIKPK